MATCPNCGKAYDGSPSFCPNCGRNLSAVHAQPTVAIPIPRLNNPYRVVVGLGTLIIFAGLFLLWLTFTFLVRFDLSLADIYNAIFQASSQLSSSAPPSLTPQLGQYFASAAGILGAIVLYPIALIAGITSIISRRMALPAGILGVLTGLMWTFGVESLKSAIEQQVSLFGAAIASLVTVGYGAYTPMIGGVVYDWVLRFQAKDDVLQQLELCDSPHLDVDG